jgi:hypothetical protein
MFNIVAQSRQGIFHIPDEVPATGGAAAQADHRLPLGLIVGDGQDFAIGRETMCGPFDHLVGGLAFA